jgi:hypothetical protein
MEASTEPSLSHAAIPLPLSAIQFEGDMKAAIWHSHLRYDVARNIDKRKVEKGERAGEISEEMDQILRLLNIAAGPDKKLMEHLRVPVSWALYKNRGNGGKE